MRSKLLGGAVSLLFLFLGCALAQPCDNTHTHQALLDLLPLGSADVTAVNDGPWSTPATWSPRAPGAGDDIAIPAGVTVTYDALADTPFDTIRVDGVLRWATDRDTRLVCDTLFTAPGSQLLLGEPGDPVPAAHAAEVVFTNTGPIDPIADPQLLGRGVIPHSTTRIVGAAKLPFTTLAIDAHAGDSTLTLELPPGETAPAGWRVGDTLVLAGTTFDETGSDADNSRFHDEVLTITAIDGPVISFLNDDSGLPALRFDHARPNGAHFGASQLRVHVANLTRNITLRSQDGPATPPQQRAHFMAMHTADVVIDGAAFIHFARTDKDEIIDEPGQNIDGAPGAGTNQRGRYAVHLHRNLPRDNQPVDFETCPPAIIRNSVVHGSIGWGFVHHDSYAILENNVAFDVVGSAFVQEAGNEIGRWEHNLSIKTTGDDNPRMTVEPFPPEGDLRVARFDFGFNGEAYWIQGASQVEFIDNVAASAAGAGANIFSHVDGNQNRDAWAVPREHLRPEIRHIVTRPDGLIDVSHAPIGAFDGFQVYNADFGLITWGHMRNQSEWRGFICPCDTINHRERSTISNFTFWNIYGQGVHLQYSSQIDLVHGLIASSDLATPGVDDKPALDLGINGEGRGYGLGMNGPTKRLLVEDVAIEGWRFAIRTPDEGQINALDVGDNTGAEGALGLPLRRSTFRGLRLANNTNHLYRRQNGFGEGQDFSNYLVLEDCAFEPTPDNTSPVAQFTTEPTGDRGVVRLSGLPSRDPDTPGEGLPPYLPASVAVADDNYIVAYAWDLDDDGQTDAWGETITARLTLGLPHRVTLTVYDHQGATDSITRTVTPDASSPYPELIVDPSFDSAQTDDNLYALGSNNASTGWFCNRATITGAQALLTGQYRSSGVAQAIYDDHQRRGPLTLAFDMQLSEGDTSPTPFEANGVTVRVYAINGEFGSDHGQATPRPDSAVPVEITLLFDETFDGEFPMTRFERTVAFPDAGSQYVFIGFDAEGVSNQIPNDFALIDNVSIAPPPPPLCAADLDADDDTDVNDFATFLLAFGAEPIDPEWNEDADLNHDGAIDVLDFALFLADFGCPN